MLVRPTPEHRRSSSRSAAADEHDNQQTAVDHDLTRSGAASRSVRKARSCGPSSLPRTSPNASLASSTALYLPVKAEARMAPSNTGATDEPHKPTPAADGPPLRGDPMVVATLCRADAPDELGEPRSKEGKPP